MNITRERYQELQHQIRDHDHAYYTLDNPTISDHEYDSLFQELLSIETDNPLWISPESPSQRVGVKPESDFSTFKHYKSMLSLANAFNDKDIFDFHERTLKNLPPHSEHPSTSSSPSVTTTPPSTST